MKKSLLGDASTEKGAFLWPEPLNHISPVFDETASRAELITGLADYKHLIDMVDWDSLLTIPQQAHIMNYICSIENHPQINNFQNSIEFISKLDMPLKYITPCSHWTPAGALEVAKLLHRLIKEKL